MDAMEKASSNFGPIGFGSGISGGGYAFNPVCDGSGGRSYSPTRDGAPFYTERSIEVLPSWAQPVWMRTSFRGRPY